MKRKTVSSQAVWEDTIGYSRAIRAGNFIEVSGTTATKGDTVVGKGSPYEQTKYILEVIAQALHQAGAEMRHVTRTRIYITDISYWQEVGRAHHAVFKDIKPAATMVQVAALIHPEHLVEIEASAFIDEQAEYLAHSTGAYKEV